MQRFHLHKGGCECCYNTCSHPECGPSGAEMCWKHSPDQRAFAPTRYSQRKCKSQSCAHQFLQQALANMPRKKIPRLRIHVASHLVQAHTGQRQRGCVFHCHLVQSSDIHASCWDVSFFLISTTESHACTDCTCLFRRLSICPPFVLYLLP